MLTQPITLDALLGIVNAIRAVVASILSVWSVEFLDFLLLLNGSCCFVCTEKLPKTAWVVFGLAEVGANQTADACPRTVIELNSRSSGQLKAACLAQIVWLLRQTSTVAIEQISQSGGQIFD